MKAKLLLFSLLAVCVLSSFILFKPIEKITPPVITTTNGGWDKFYLGAMDTQYGTASKFDSLGLTIWHRYIIYYIYHI